MRTTTTCPKCSGKKIVVDLGDVDRLAAEHPGVRIVDGTVPSKGPFR